MRPIDADALTVKLNIAKKEFDIGDCADKDVVVNGAVIVSVVNKFFIKTIAEAPTVDIAVARENVQPLTLEELWKINGEPVWTVTIDLIGSGRWELVYSDNDYIYFKTVCEDYKMTDMEIKNTYGKTWFAYRRKAAALEAQGDGEK